MNSLLSYFVVAIAVLVTPASPAPTPAPTERAPDFCLFDEALEAQLEANPELVAELQAQNEAAARALDGSRPARLLEDYTLPVVVHVVSPSLIDTIAPEEQVNQAIGFLNAAFANNGPFAGEGVNTQLQFCLATRDPEGMPSNGITFTQSPLGDVQFETQDEDLKSLVRWEPTEYINIYVVREVSTFAMGEVNVDGYAYFPLFHGTDIDGIVIEADNFGVGAQATTPLVHQMGHYLGLYHTFEGGCENENCLLDGDRVCDTPPDQTVVAVPCDFDVNSCETDVNPSDPNNPFDEDQFDLQNNYLDFSDLPCYTAFTLGQAERMQFFIEQVRFSLLETNSCLPPCPIDVVADFGSNPAVGSGDSIVLGAFFNFFSNSTNADSLIWRLNGDSLSIDGSVDIQFNEVGTQTLVLTVFNDSTETCVDQLLVNYTVFCPVRATIEASDLYATVGQAVTLNNVGQAASSFEWRIDGTVVSTDSNYVYTPTVQGTQEICLRAIGDLCEATECITITTTSDGANCLSRAFLAEISLPSGPFSNSSLTQLPNGNQLHAIGLLDGINLIETDEIGEIVTQTKLSTGALPVVAQVVDMLIDTDGHLAVLYQLSLPDPVVGMLRYDRTAGALLWSNTYPLEGGAAPAFTGLTELPGAARYLVVGRVLPQATPSEASDFTVDRATGALLSSAKQTGITFSAFDEAADRPDGAYYTVGSTGNTEANTRLTLSRFEADGTPTWSYRYGADDSVLSRLVATDLTLHDSTVAFVGTGNPNGSGGSPNQGFLYTTDLDGTPRSGLRVDVAGFPDDAIQTIARVSDGYVLAGGYGFSPPNLNQDIYVMRISDAGDLLWITGLTDPDRDLASGVTGHVDGDSYYLSSTRLDVTTIAVQPALTFARVNLSDGSVGSAPCAPVESITATLTVLPLERDTQSLLLDSLEINTAAIPFTVGPGAFVITQQCATLCDEIACNFLDDDGDGLVDCCDPDAAGAACCADFVPLEISPDGSDVYRNCDNNAVVLNAGSGYTSYLWQDGSRDSVFTAWQPGTYYVTVGSDNCGGVETDTVRIVDNPDLVARIEPNNATVCPGDTVFFEFVNPFQTVNWLPEDAVDCDTCRSTFAVVEDGPLEIRGIGRYSSGCYSVDTLFISTQTLAGSEDVQKCIGETIEVFGEEVTEPGAYSTTLTSFDGCDSIATVNVTDFPAINANIVIETSCEGGAIFGTLTASATAGAGGPYTYAWNDGTTGPVLADQPAGEYTVTITDAAGCQTTQSATVQLNLAVEVSGTPDCLDGDYAETVMGIGSNGTGPYTFTFSDGDSQLLPGTYGVTVTDANGCTAASEFTVAETDPVQVGISDPEVVCIDGLRATATAEPSGGVGPYTFVWSSGETTATAENLQPGTNSVVITDAAGCTETAEVEVALQTIEGVELPNAIRPDDPDNSTFAPVYEEGTSYEIQNLQVFNRWGQLIFESDDPTAGWDGRRDGEVVVMDVYVYRITIGCGGDTGLSFFGDLTVLR